ncbi:MAG TPA: hypothetical protein VEW03_03595 [Longimicrobiaceae bacterium]|nr:hypothetical protein [Longimicrobiaceae bacterium]
MGDPPASAEVHAGIAFAAETEPPGTRERTASRAREVADAVAERAGDLGQRARSVAGEVGHRAEELAAQARERAGELGERAHLALESRGVLAKLRENPLPALGIAFAAGFLLAGGGRERAGGTTGRARQELRNALLAGLSAGVAQGARGFLRRLGAEDSVLSEVASSLPGLGGPAGGRSAAAPGRGTTGGRTPRRRPPSRQENV